MVIVFLIKTSCPGKIHNIQNCTIEHIPISCMISSDVSAHIRILDFWDVKKLVFFYKIRTMHPREENLS